MIQPIFQAVLKTGDHKGCTVYVKSLHWTNFGIDMSYTVPKDGGLDTYHLFNHFGREEDYTLLEAIGHG